jgi:hypothetical protein
MPVRTRKTKRRHRANITAEAIEIFRRGVDMVRGPHDPREFRDLKLALAAALGRSKFSASPLDREPRSLIGCDPEPIDAVMRLRAHLMNSV